MSTRLLASIVVVAFVLGWVCNVLVSGTLFKLHVANNTVFRSNNKVYYCHEIEFIGAGEQGIEI